MKKGRFLLLLQSLACVALAAVLALSAVSVYREGAARKAADPMESVYTPETVKEKLIAIAPLCLALLIPLLLALAFKAKEDGAQKPMIDGEIRRNLFAARVANPSEAMKKEQAIQKRLLLGGWAAFGLCMVPIAVYLLNPAHFPENDLEGMFFSLLGTLLPWTAAGLAALAAAYTLREKSVKRETEAAKAQLKAEKEAGIAPAPKQRKKPPRKTPVRAAVLIAAALFIAAGILNGSALDVLIKAITICTECVGLG